MQTTLSWSGSEVLGLVWATDAERTVRLLMSAAQVKVLPAQGPALWGYLKPLEVVLKGASISQDLSCAIGALASATVETGHGTLVSTSADLALPWHHPQPLMLTLQFRHGCEVRIKADSALCEPADDARFMESYAC